MLFSKKTTNSQWSSRPHYPPSKKPGFSKSFRIIKGRSHRVSWTLRGLTRPSALTRFSWKTSSNQASNLKDDPWVNPVQVVPKKGGMTVVKNEKDELIPCFLGYFQITIALEDQEKTTFTCPYGTFTYKWMPFGLCNAPTTFQRCMTAIFHELIKDSMEVFMDDFSVFGSSFNHCLKNLEKMLKRSEETNLVLNWEKCHFMVKEGTVLGHKVSGSGIEVDKAKIEAISKFHIL
ncbi:reverse transcriptase domain-containing protein [Tanacetum coccineum]|uniref:Reverse transcriptase domain-containing protein n=1 Tax=Tanacetum coccineum TaxID=301880 RepID=A0ABQ5GH34_9ASTR